ncbi:hypothetical protein [Peribacillus sp. NPDC096448]|uniref:hypothetical protein n=1 Tax=Peribacillus sp. NPDC096448 TaxID=3364395 RepID=UPI003802BED2
MLNLIAFKYPLFMLGLAMNMIMFLNMLSMLVVLPMYMQMALLVSALATGLMMLGIGMVLASVQTNTLPKHYPDGIAITQTSQQVSGAIGIAVMVSLFSAKQNGYLTDVANDLPAAAASGSSLVFKISLIFAIVNVVPSLFMKKPK